MSRSITIIRESRVGVPGLMLESMNMHQLYEAVESNEESKKGFASKLWEKFRDSSLVDLGLDILGLFGGAIGAALAPETMGIAAIIAMIPDLVNAFRRFSRGDKFGGALSLICAIPFAGDAAAVFLESERIMSGGARATLGMIKKLGEWAEEHRTMAKQVQTGAGKITDVVAEHLPGMEKHHGEIVKAVGILTSGDKRRMAKLAKESGAKIDDIDDIDSDSSPDKDIDSGDSTSANLAESTIRRAARNRRIVDLYRGNLY